MERYFSKNSDGTVEFTPIAKDQASIIYEQIRKQLSYLRQKIDNEQNLLDVTPKGNDDLKIDCLNNLIIYKVELKKTENCFKYVKMWYDKNNLHYPGSEKDGLLKKKHKELLEKYKSQIRKKIGGAKNRGEQKSKQPKKKKPIQHSSRIIRRNKEIRSKYQKLTEKEHKQSKYAMEEIANEYELSKHTIRDIIYKYE